MRDCMESLAKKWCEAWNVSIVFPDNVKLLVCLWDNQKIRKQDKPIWSMAFFGFIWTIWIHRNNIVFKGCEFSVDRIYVSTLLRIGGWAKSKWPCDIPSISDFMRFPSTFTVRVVN
ncbi:hypothetical protein F3Y22_tig00020138pilonHSYRG00026 [Hibiscus syriacus]|uniref:Reverse transcriptase zinc-binding domain-containing protein n=1 Tax=Hibiscus syriacus TaxID=106335 RepID=A0A6A3BWS5_HIBSY|nr:hypothetical protein F3Y22_tig00020138pilonHSYRG00026 [Hibiscus syriacus]